jgi:luciferase family oxidoreductase group 1
MSLKPTLYSVLDQAPIRSDVGAGAAIREMPQLARHVEALGYHRYWIAEHHAFGGLASTAPEALIGHVASLTDRIRVGSGATLLPNHRAIHVAEVFRTLEALYPGRIDLGIGRAQGARHEQTVQALHRGEKSEHATGYSDQIDELLAFGGVRPLPVDHPMHDVRAGPDDVPLPPVYLLGSSPDSAGLAAALGLGYGFAAYTRPDKLVEAMLRYRREFTPSEQFAEPHSILGVRVIVGETDEHAQDLALPSRLMLVQALTTGPRPLVSVQEAKNHAWSEAERAAEAELSASVDVIGAPETVSRRLAGLVDQTEADEVIVTTNAFAQSDRFASFTRLAELLGL